MCFYPQNGNREGTVMHPPKPTAPIYDPERFPPQTTVDLNGHSSIIDILSPDVCEILWVRDGVIDLWTESGAVLWRVFTLDSLGNVCLWAGAITDRPNPFMPARATPLPLLRRLIAHTACGLTEEEDLGVLHAYTPHNRPPRRAGRWSPEFLALCQIKEM